MIGFDKTSSLWATISVDIGITYTKSSLWMGMYGSIPFTTILEYTFGAIHFNYNTHMSPPIVIPL
jgi:hypothetical protein